jgi:hypothetical protein
VFVCGSCPPPVARVARLLLWVQNLSPGRQRPPVGRRNGSLSAAGGPVPAAGVGPPRGPRARGSHDAGAFGVPAPSPVGALSPAVASSPYAQKPTFAFPPAGVQVYVCVQARCATLPGSVFLHLNMCAVVCECVRACLQE